MSVISLLLFSTVSSSELTCWPSALWRGLHAFDVLAVETPGEIFFAAATGTLDVINWR